MKRIFARAIYLISAIIVAAFVIGWAAFYMMAERVANQIIGDWTHRGYTIIGDIKPGGFPARPAISGSIKITTPDESVTVTIPNFTAQGLFIPGTDIQFTAPNGITLSDPNGSILWPEWSPISSIFASFTLPNDEQHISIHWVDLNIGQSRIAGNGNVGVNTFNQLTGIFTARISNATWVVQQLRETGVVDKKQELLMAMLFRGLEFHDPEMDERVISIPLSINNNRVYAGPIMIGALPADIIPAASATHNIGH